jgi:hypothetical protein
MPIPGTAGFLRAQNVKAWAPGAECGTTWACCAETGVGYVDKNLLRAGAGHPDSASLLLRVDENTVRALSPVCFVLGFAQSSSGARTV